MIVIHLARKPLSESSVAANVLKHGTGAVNVDACRVGYSDNEPDSGANFYRKRGQEMPLNRQNYFGQKDRTVLSTPHQTGRWPANLILQHRAGSACPITDLDAQSGSAGAAAPVRGTEASRPVEAEGVYSVRERVPGVFHGDKGGASRFFKQVGSDD
jgi:site-specific DNA-methyltransferase (adenine-specific)